VRITGAVRTPEAVVRRAFGVAAGQDFNYSAIDTGKHRVMGLGFHDVEVALLRGSSDELVDVRVDITE
jgi:outer membrane protein assembly factor BamA